MSHPIREREREREIGCEYTFRLGEILRIDDGELVMQLDGISNAHT